MIRSISETYLSHLLQSSFMCIGNPTMIHIRWIASKKKTIFECSNQKRKIFFGRQSKHINIRENLCAMMFDHRSIKHQSDCKSKTQLCNRLISYLWFASIICYFHCNIYQLYLLQTLKKKKNRYYMMRFCKLVVQKWFFARMHHDYVIFMCVHVSVCQSVCTVVSTDVSIKLMIWNALSIL